MNAEPSTPLMRQYHAVKTKAPNALLFFRLGDFYELFYEDALVAARELEITLTSRNKEKGEPVPMCGVPAHSAETYIARLLQKGYRIAICDQMEDPKTAKKLVRREITRIVTPGTATEAPLLRAGENNYLAAIAHKDGAAGLAYADLSTGEFRATEMDFAEAAASLEQIGVKEVLLPEGAQAPPAAESSPRWLRTDIEAWLFSPAYGERTLLEHFRLHSLDGCGLSGHPLAIAAAGALLHYLRDTQRGALGHLDAPVFFARSETMALDAVTVRNLELIEPLFSADVGGTREATLLSVLSFTLTGMGSRLLRRRLLHPLLNRVEIEERLDAVEEFLKSTITRTRLRTHLKEIGDLERLLARVTLGSASPREMLALGRSLAKLPALRELLKGMSASLLHKLYEEFDAVAEVRDRILEAIADDPPVNLSEGGVIRTGFHSELDQLRDLNRNSKQVIARIEARERQRTGIPSLKVRFNSVFGYYIEVSKANLHLVPDDYQRKQTLVGAERFITPELKDLETRILEAEERILKLERDLFSELRTFAASQAQRIKSAAAFVAEIDLSAALAEAAAQFRWVRPRFSERGELRVTAGRHPVVERILEREGSRFIPNDVWLDPDEARIAVITGPNMGGKSTYLRQVAMIVILAQMGCFVPAGDALLPIVDRIFTRIGASDNLARGRSTFMVEMTETAVILNTATRNSLIVLDEIGRGTATFDGLALAWAVVEYIHERIGAKALFATHYHELTELAEQLSGVRNLRVAVKESDDNIVFLRKVEPGAADRSYGIEVARLAGLPASVIERARQVLAEHERSEHEVTEELAPKRRRHETPLQIELFEPVNYQIAERIRSLNLDEIRPIEALKLLAELQEELKRK